MAFEIYTLIVSYVLVHILKKHNEFKKQTFFNYINNYERYDLKKQTKYFYFKDQWNECEHHDPI